MDSENQKQFVDELLDAGLARYSNVAPRPGLEGRILADVRAEPGRRSWFVWAGWLASGAVAAAIILGVLALMRLRTPPPPTVPVVARGGVQIGLVPTPRPMARQLAAPETWHGRPGRVHGRDARATAPRQAAFPSPAPLSEQEKLLLACLKLPPETQESIFKKGPDVSEELEIKPLPPLADDSEMPESENDR